MSEPHLPIAQVVDEKLHTDRPSPLSVGVEVATASSQRIRPEIRSIKDEAGENHGANLEPAEEAQQERDGFSMMVTVRKWPENRPDAIDRNQNMAVLNTGLQNVEPENDCRAVCIAWKLKKAHS